MIKPLEIKPSCCAFGGMTEEVHVIESDCPIKREVGKREVQDFRNGTTRHECTCIYISSFGGGVKACEHYIDCKQVQRDKQKVWRVFCGATSGLSTEKGADK